MQYHHLHRSEKSEIYLTEVIPQDQFLIQDIKEIQHCYCFLSRIIVDTEVKLNLKCGLNLFNCTMPRPYYQQYATVGNNHSDDCCIEVPVVHLAATWSPCSFPASPLFRVLIL